MKNNWWTGLISLKDIQRLVKNAISDFPFLDKIPILMIMCLIVFFPLLVFQIYPVDGSNSNNYLGVDVGDWIEYEFDNNGTISIITYKIVKTEGTLVIFNVTSGNEYIIIETKIASLSPDVLLGDHTEFIIPTNSKPTDTLYGFIAEGIAISKIENRVYSGSERAVLYVNHETYYNSNNNSLIEMRWDNETGILVEAFFFTQLQDTNTTSSIEIIKTNMWETQPSIIDQNILLLIIGVFLIISISIIFFFKLRKKRMKKL